MDTVSVWPLGQGFPRAETVASEVLHLEGSRSDLWHYRPSTDLITGATHSLAGPVISYKKPDWAWQIYIYILTDLS